MDRRVNMSLIKQVISGYLFIFAYGSLPATSHSLEDRCIHTRLYNKPNYRDGDESNHPFNDSLSWNERKRIGSMNVDFGSQPSHAQRFTDTNNIDDDEMTWTGSVSHNLPSTAANKGATISIQMDSSAFWRLLSLMGSTATYFTAAFMGTLRLLAPMIFARRLLVFIYNIISDYMTGRYVRKTYTRLERTYLMYYEAPAVLRAVCRITAQVSIYFVLSSIMAWLVGVSHPPCRGDNRGLASFCALLWTSAVVGTGHALSTAISIWGGPIRLQAKFRPSRSKNTWNSFIMRPWRIIHWMKNPEAFLNMIATPEVKPFDPKPEIFPATWLSLRLLQIFAVSKVVSTELNNCDWCSSKSRNVSKLMKSYFVQLALCDEWYRVFVIEKRVGLGIAVVSVYLIAMIFLIYFSLRMNPTITFLLIPSFLALVTSAWMNMVIYWSHQRDKKGYTNYFGKV